MPPESMGAIMRISALALLATVLPSVAIAADLASAPPLAQTVFSWTGVYLGANGGYGSAAGRSTLTGLTGPLAGLVSTSSGDGLKGPLAGGQAGFNWQTG